MSNLEEIAARLGKSKKTANGYDCACPAHSDSRPSLSIAESADGKILYHCQSGCSQDAVRAALESLGLMRSASNASGLPPQQVIYYTYTDAAGNPLFRKARRLPKNFYIEHYKNGAWMKGIGAMPRVLYRLPELRAAIAAGKRVAICEGEKDANRVAKESGIICTCNVAGAQHWMPEYNAEFEGADVTLFYDNDEPGRNRKADLVAALSAVAKKITVINLPAEFKDISDFWDGGKEIDDSMREVILCSAPESIALDAGDWLEQAQYEIDPFMENLFDLGDKVAIIGKSKTRKSFFALQLLLAAATGQDFLGYSIPKARKALYVQYEIKDAHMHRRLERTADAMGILPHQLRNRLTIINARGKSISRDTVQKWVKKSGAEIVLLDPIYKLMTDGENAVEDFKPLFQWFDTLAADTGCAVLYVHHDRKGFTGEQDLADRGAGSSIIGRDFDAAFFLTPHEDEQLVVLETLTRNYASEEKRSLAWANCFSCDDAPARVKTSRSRSTRSVTTLADWIPQAEAIMAAQGGQPMGMQEFIRALRDAGASKEMARDAINEMVATGKAEFEFKKAQAGAPAKTVKAKNPA